MARMWLRQSGCAIAAAFVAATFAFPTLAAAESLEGETVRPLASTPFGAEVHWSRADLEDAEPLPIVELPGSPPGAARTAAIAGEATVPTSSPEGIEIGETESTLSPNHANGKLFGEFRIPVGETQVKVVKYQCSASVVPSPRGNVILTAAHCVIDPSTGTAATPGSLVFIPAYRNGVGPDGAWQMSERGAYVTERWFKWAETKQVPPNEGEDLAFLRLDVNRERENLHYFENVEDIVGSLGIDFNQPCSQTYTQFGYPAELPYSGEALFSHIAPFVGTDLNPAITPRPIKIASDFTRGASGGPWTIGPSTAPTALSLTAYGYENQPGYLYGPYFGEAARKVYERAAGKFVPVGIEETCVAMPEPPAPSEPTPTPAAPPASPPVASPTPLSAVSLRLTRVRHRANGSAVLIAKVNTAGVLKLTGGAIRDESLEATAAGKYRLVVAPKGPTARRLRQVGEAKVGVKVAFRASGKTRRVKRKIALNRRAVARPSGQRAARLSRT
jgi:hypothetical protein